MITADYIFLGIILLILTAGAGLGFGKCLQSVTNGFFGTIISAVICYFIFGIVLSWPFVQDLLSKFITFLTDQNVAFCNLLVKIRVDIILFSIVLFLVVQIIRKVVFSLIKDFMEIKNPVIIIINRVFGVLLFAVIIAVIVLIGLQIAYFIDGSAGNVYKFFESSVFKLNELYLNNPLNKLIDNIVAILPQATPPGTANSLQLLV